MTELKEDSLKFILMFMEAEPSNDLLREIENYKKNKTMKIVIDQENEEFDFDSFDFEAMAEQFRKHIPALSDAQLNHAINMCKLKKDEIGSTSKLIQVVIDHL